MTTYTEKLNAVSDIIMDTFGYSQFENVERFADDGSGCMGDNGVWLCPKLITRMMIDAYEQGRRDGS